jgi:translation initiation factor 2B subunit (eIF-2B alpha/beta/delta family)
MVKVATKCVSPLNSSSYCSERQYVHSLVQLVKKTVTHQVSDPGRIMSMTPPRFEPAILRFVAQCLNQLFQRVPPTLVVVMIKF